MAGARAYLDAAAGEPLAPVAREALLAALDDGWADPRRLYAEGRRAALLLDAARASVAAVLGAQPDEVSFTGSGTAAVHLGVLGGLARRPGSPGGAYGRLVTSAVEHSAVLSAGAHAERGGGEVATIAVDRQGRVALGAFTDAVREPGTSLAALQSANQEVGTVQPVAAAHAACAEAGVPLLVDAAQTVGRMPVPPWDLLTASAHKWGGPPGVGVLAVRRAVRWRAPLPVDEAEGGRVPGALDLPAVLAAATALEAAVAGAAAEAARQRALVARLREELARRVPDVEVVGDPDDRLPHVLTFSCLFVDGEALVTELDRLGVSVGSGSACTASTLRPSHVLAAMGVLTHGNVRVSLPRGVRAADVERLLDVLPGVVQGLRERAGVAGL
ncbi:cysteine desulfurase family protein [Motilibacter aurantiacus]|uniref:cysteine desulfurase family protein n=1 Tax=Motilibacter aurantiacus TaxID=2714955 RepID=UPI00140B5E5B|nr:aminotransferase class V-fold PLP-dependent enzyme [Motilibacter aurantiacus]NHC44898.1 aminotransferase class V-fold PLP-dependent enzyme [Motilibacter aurantiacus]